VGEGIVLVINHHSHLTHPTGLKIFNLAYYAFDRIEVSIARIFDFWNDSGF